MTVVDRGLLSLLELVCTSNKSDQIPVISDASFYICSNIFYFPKFLFPQITLFHMSGRGKKSGERRVPNAPVEKNACPICPI